MKKNIFKYILPSPAVALSLLVLPFALSVYFLATQYSDRFVSEQDISYIDVQSSWISRLFLDQSWLSWFNRFMDFALWGLLATVVLFVIWFFGSAKVAVKNHYAQEDFRNFRASKNSWHGQFFVVAFLKFLLILAVFYSFLSILTRLAPRLAVDISFMIQDFTWQSLITTSITCLYVVLFQLLIVLGFKTFKLLRSE